MLLDTTDAVAGRFAAAIWECPQLVEIGDHWVILLSLVSEPHADRVAYLVGDLVSTDTGLLFAPGSGGLVDHGHDFYAPAVLRAGRRVLLWGWAWEDRPEEAVRDAGWAGVLTIARDLTLTDDRQLRSRPAAEPPCSTGRRRRSRSPPGRRGRRCRPAPWTCWFRPSRGG